MTTACQPRSVFVGSIKEILTLFLPIILMIFSTSLVSFFEKLFLTKVSAEAMEAAVNVSHVIRMFQMPCILLAMMAQVCVGRLQGAGKNEEIGSNIWQFIWFSLLSILVTLPISLVYGYLYFKGTVIAESAISYFLLLAFINFLYPLDASLSCFHLGRGKTSLILYLTLATDLINLLLAYLLIFGLDGWLPSLGLMGGALSILITKGSLCLFLFFDFLSAKYAKKYGSHKWHFQPRLFYDCIFPGFFRALNSISICLCWTFIAHLMIEKEGDYLLIWSLGSTIGLFLPFIGTAICQAMTTISSNIIGSGEFQLLRGVTLSGMTLISMIVGVMAIPMLLFPEQTFHLLFSNIDLAETSVRKVFLGLWLSFTFGTFTYLPLSCILAFKDTKFLLLTGTCCWLNVFLTMFLAVNVFNIAADRCWIVLGFTNLFDLLLVWWRANRLTIQKKTVAELMPSRL